MKNYIPIGLGVLFTLFALVLFSCNKQDSFLDKKPNASLAVPTTLSDFELLLNNESLFNATSSPGLINYSCDDLYVTDATFKSTVSPVDHNTYIFAKDIYQGTTTYNDWSTPYEQIYYCNVVLDGLAKLSPNPKQAAEFNTVKGEALFFRAFAFYSLVQAFSLPYDIASSSTDPGIPLVTSSDINKRYGRGSVQDTYNQIFNDATMALGLLPSSLTSVSKPCKISCNALLSRINLATRNYNQAYTYANNCLLQDSILVDYNTITPEKNSISYTTPIAEDIFHTCSIGYSMQSYIQMDSTLYNSYDANDLRKNVFFRTQSPGLRFRGTYDIHNALYSGLATDEIYLIRAECNARSGNPTAALNDLNKLLKNRYVANTYIPLAITGQDSLLKRILLEREKELFLRGLRWTDLRRLNKETGFQKNVTHVINGTTYMLPPNDPGYALPIPDQEIQLTGIPQNTR